MILVVLVVLLLVFVIKVKLFKKCDRWFKLVLFFIVILGLLLKFLVIDKNFLIFLICVWFFNVFWIWSVFRYFVLFSRFFVIFVIVKLFSLLCRVKIRLVKF